MLNEITPADGGRRSLFAFVAQRAAAAESIRSAASLHIGAKRMSDNIQYNDSETLEVAKRQKAVLWLIVVNLFTFWIPFASIVMGIIGIVFIYKLAKALKCSLTWLYVVLSFIPLVGLVALLVLNGKATGALRAHGVRVGLMGANKEDLGKLTPRAA